MKTLKTASVLLIITLAQCMPPDQEPVPLSRAEILMQHLKLSQVYSDLESLNIKLDLDHVEIGEFPQFELVTIPIKHDSKSVSKPGRKGMDTSAILLKFYNDSRWEHFLRIDLKGSNLVEDYSDFSGEITLDAYSEDVESQITYINGKFAGYEMQSNAVDNQRFNAGARNESDSKCQSICHALDCAGIKFEQKGWFGKLWCAYNIITCIGSEVIQCESEGCANSVYKKCGML